MDGTRLALPSAQNYFLCSRWLVDLVDIPLLALPSVRSILSARNGCLIRLIGRGSAAPLPEALSLLGIDG